MQDIIERCKAGDSHSQFKLYKMLAPKMLLMAMRYVKSRQEAEDCLQEAFVKLFKNIASFNGDAAFETWAMRILINTALTTLKQTAHRNDNVNLDVAQQLPQENIGDEQEYADMLAMLRSLPDVQRVVFNLFVIEGYSHKEIAETLIMEESTSRSHLMRAKESLKKKHNLENKYNDAKAIS